MSTYGELLDAADHLSCTLHKTGLSVGERVAVWLPSRVETVEALLACSRNGYICCPSLHRNHRTREIVELLKRRAASALIAEAGYGADSATDNRVGMRLGLRIKLNVQNDYRVTREMLSPRMSGLLAFIRRPGSGSDPKR